jgi:hypothetical protein
MLPIDTYTQSHKTFEFHIQTTTSTNQTTERTEY